MKDRLFTKKHPLICKHCPYETHPFVPGVGDLDAELMILGRDPGEDEEEKALCGLCNKHHTIPFIGQAGDVVNVTLNELGMYRFIPKSNVYVTNIVKCRPPGNKAGTKEWKQAAQQCQAYLRKELAEINPTVISALGNEACNALGLKGKITNLRANVHRSPITTAKIVPAFHSGYILRSPNELPKFVSDMSRALRELGSDEIVTTKDKGYKYQTIKSMKGFRSFFKVLMKTHDVDVDVECWPAAWWQGQIVCIGFCLSNGIGIVLPVREYGIKTRKVRNKETGRRRTVRTPWFKPFWSEEDWSEIHTKLYQFFWDKRIVKRFHNGKFDMHHLLNEGWPILRDDALPFEDTMVKHALVDENSRHGLKSLVGTYVPEMEGYEKDMKDEEDEDFKILSVPMQKLWQYNAGDVCATRFLDPILDKMIRKDKLEDVYQYNKELLQLMFEMEREGAPIDKEEFRKVGVYCKRVLKTVRRHLFEIHGKEFNLGQSGSTDDVRRILFEDRDLPVISTTDQGTASTAAEVLEILEQQTNDEFVAELRIYRAWAKLYTQYVKGFIDLIDKETWRLHTTFRQDVAVTGRTSSRKPNLQNIPVQGPIKRFFKAPKGWYLITADLSQAELRVAAVVSNDKAMIGAFEGGADLHAEVGKIIYGRDDITKEERVKTKTTNFSVLYQKQVEAAAIDAGVPVDEMQDFFDQYWETFKDLKKWITRQKRVALRKGRIVSPTGRIRRFDIETAQREGEGAVGHIEREAVNFIPQNTASDVNNKAAIRAQKRFKKLGMQARMILIVHDQQIALVPAGEVPRAARIMVQEMERPVPELNNVVIPADIGIGRSWAEADLASEEWKGGLEEALRRFKRRDFPKLRDFNYRDLKVTPKQLSAEVREYKRLAALG